MKKISKNKVFRIIKKYRIVILLLLLLLSVAPYAYSKYISSLDGSATASVDGVHYSPYISGPIEKELNEDGQVEYTFAIRNFDTSNTLNEVLMEYYLKINIPQHDVLDNCIAYKSMCLTDTVKTQCPDTCGYNIGVDDITFNYKLYYYNTSSSTWTEINKETTGTYAGYFKGGSKLTFDAQKQDNYKIIVETSDDLVIDTSYIVGIDLKTKQTQS